MIDLEKWNERIDELLKTSTDDKYGAETMSREALEMFREFYGNESSQVHLLEAAISDSRWEPIKHPLYQIAKEALETLKKSLERSAIKTEQTQLLAEELDALRRDLKWLLAILRVYRSLKQRLIKLLPAHRLARRTLAITAPVVFIIGVTVHYLYG